MDELKYPIGKFHYAGPQSAAEQRACIDAIEAVPGQLRQAVAGLTDSRLDTPYRPQGWTLRQVVHHVADSHINAYQRFKLALTEDHPRIKTYREKLWAEEVDARTLPVEVSLKLLEAMHERWVTRLRTMDDAAFARTLDHPEQGAVNLDFMLALYAWHGPHHTAHITSWRKRQGV
jgi:uncharacterized damage-inducible protein DinB